MLLFLSLPGLSHASLSINKQEKIKYNLLSFHFPFPASAVLLLFSFFLSPFFLFLSFSRCSCFPWPCPLSFYFSFRLFLLPSLFPCPYISLSPLPSFCFSPSIPDSLTLFPILPLSPSSILQTHFPSPPLLPSFYFYFPIPSSSFYYHNWTDKH